MDAAVETRKLVYLNGVFIRQPNQRQRPTYVAITITITITSFYGPGPTYIFAPPHPTSQLI